MLKYALWADRITVKKAIETSPFQLVYGTDVIFPVQLGILLPPKLYLVVFYQVSLVNRIGLTCLDFREPLEVLLGSACCIISHVHTPWGNCNKCSSMIVSVKDSVS